MNPNTRKILALALVAIMLASAGCAGWGTDGPADTDENENDSDGTPLVCGYTEGVNAQQNGDSIDDCPTDDTAEDGDDTSQSDAQSDDSAADPAPSKDGAESETHSVTVSVAGPDEEALEGVDIEIVTYDEGEPVASGTTNENGAVTFDLTNGDYEVVVDHDTTDYVAYGTFLFAVDGSGGEFGIVLSPPVDDAETADQPPEADQPKTPTDDSGLDAPARPPADDASEAPADDEQDTDSEPAPEQPEQPEEPAEGDDAEPEQPEQPEQSEQPADDSEPEEPPADDGSEQPDEPEQPEQPEQPPEDDQPEEPEQPEQPEQPEEPEAPDSPEQPEQPDEETHTLTVTTGESVAVEDIPITVEGEGVEQTKTTDENGTVTFELPDGEYTVSGTDKNGDTDSETVVIDGSDAEVLLGGLSPPVPEMHSLTVEVVDAETGEPIEGATVSGVGGFHPLTGDQLFEVTTGADGTASTEVYEAWYATSVTAEGYESDNPGITVDGDTTVTLELQPEGDTIEDDQQEPTEGNTTGNESAAVALAV